MLIESKAAAHPSPWSFVLPAPSTGRILHLNCLPRRKLSHDLHGDRLENEWNVIHGTNYGTEPSIWRWGGDVSAEALNLKGSTFFSNKEGIIFILVNFTFFRTDERRGEGQSHLKFNSHNIPQNANVFNSIYSEFITNSTPATFNWIKMTRNKWTLWFTRSDFLTKHKF